jgi:hypothetical protein
MKILLGDFDIVRTKVVSKPAIGNESLYDFRNDNGVRIVNFATSEI